MRFRQPVRLLVLTFVAAGTAWLGAVPAQAVDTYVPAPDGVARVVPLSHDCDIIGADQYGNEAVHCADTIAQGFPDRTVVWGQNQVLCQNWAKQLVECAGIQETPALCLATTPTSCASGPRGVCGVRYGHSPCGVRRVTNNSSSNPVRIVDPVCPEVWGESLNAVVVLPQSGKTVGGTGYNSSANHFYVCGR
jgi:hypothetical protein